MNNTHLPVFSIPLVTVFRTGTAACELAEFPARPCAAFKTGTARAAWEGGGLCARLCVESKTGTAACELAALPESSCVGNGGVKLPSRGVKVFCGMAPGGVKLPMMFSTAVAGVGAGGEKSAAKSDNAAFLVTAGCKHRR